MIRLVETFVLNPGEYRKVDTLNEKDQTIIVEKKGEPKQEYTAKGVFTFPISRPNKENLNGRIYNEKLWKRTEKILKDSSTFGLMDHPEQEGSTKDIWCVWRNLRFSENREMVVADAYLIGDWGNMVKEILEAGGKVGLSTSGFGEFLEDDKTINPDTFELERVADFVFNPSYEVYGTLSDKKEQINEEEDKMEIDEKIVEATDFDYTLSYEEEGNSNLPVEESKKKEEDPVDIENTDLEEKKDTKKEDDSEEEPEDKTDEKKKKEDEEEPEDKKDTKDDDEVEEKKKKKKEDEEDPEEKDVEEKKKKKEDEEEPEDEVDEKKKKKEGDTSTFKCPTCGGKVLANTEYCVSCKKKVKNPNGKKEDDSEDKKDKEDDKKDDKKKDESLMEKFFKQNMLSLFKQAKEKETPEERVKTYEDLVSYFEDGIAVSLREEIVAEIEKDKVLIVSENDTSADTDAIVENTELEEKYKNSLELLDSLKVYAKKLKEMYEISQAEKNGMVTATEYKEIQVYLEGVEKEKEALEKELHELKTFSEEEKTEEEVVENKIVMPEHINPEVQKYYDSQEYANPSIVIIKEDILRCRTLMEAQKTMLRLKPLWDTVESAYDRKFVGAKDSFVESSKQKLPIKQGWM